MDRERRLEERLREAHRNQQRLVAEFQNRSRNTLSVIRSLVRRTAATSHSVEDFGYNLDGRLGAHGRAQAAVMRDPIAGTDMASLLSDELLAHALHEGESLTISGPEVRLQPRAAELFALVFNELVLNAVKFGALRRNVGRVDATWVVTGGEEDSQLVFRWQETNDPADRGSPPGTPGFGTELIEKTLQYELGAEGTLTHDAPGSVCVIRVPAALILARPGQGDGNAASEESAPLR